MDLGGPSLSSLRLQREQERGRQDLSVAQWLREMHRTAPRGPVRGRQRQTAWKVPSQKLGNTSKMITRDLVDNLTCQLCIESNPEKHERVYYFGGMEGERRRERERDEGVSAESQRPHLH